MVDVIDFEYDEWDCDDIGRMYYIKYVCPHCHTLTSYSSLKSYGDNTDYVAKGIDTACSKCGEACRIIYKPDA